MKTNKEWLRYIELTKVRPNEFINDGTLDIITDEETVEKYEIETGKKIGVVYESPYHILAVDLVKDQKGKLFAYERILPVVEKGAVVAVPIFNGKIVLLKQYRHSLRCEQYSFPRGFAEPKLTPEENLKKELKEEIAGEVEQVHFLGEVVADSGLEGKCVSVFLCYLSDCHLQDRYEEINDIIFLSLPELQQWIQSGKINDGFTLAALSFLYNNQNNMLK